MKVTFTNTIAAFTVSAGITVLIAGCIISIVPMIIAGLSLFLAGTLITLKYVVERQY